MITNNNSWSLGATPNKNLDQIEPSIPSHLAGDPFTITAEERRPARLTSADLQAVPSIAARGSIPPASIPVHLVHANSRPFAVHNPSTPAFSAVTTLKSILAPPVESEILRKWLIFPHFSFPEANSLKLNPGSPMIFRARPGISIRIFSSEETKFSHLHAASKARSSPPEASPDPSIAEHLPPPPQAVPLLPPKTPR
jgi:hypothetical protein